MVKVQICGHEYSLLDGVSNEFGSAIFDDYLCLVKCLFCCDQASSVNLFAPSLVVIIRLCTLWNLCCSSVGAAVAIVGLAAYRVYAARKNASG